MEHGEGKDSSQSVRVAVNIRPLIPSELLIGCTNCITVVPGEPQVQIGSHVFTYDYVYGNSGSPSPGLYDECVAPLLDAFFKGYNATVLAYGQTGSGKTYTMGTNYHGEESNGGVIPKVMDRIFKRVEAMRDSTEFMIRVSFIEIFKEEVFDLLDTSSCPPTKGEISIKPNGLGRVPIQIRETVSGGITLAGVTEPEVNSKEEMANYLSRGSISRATGSTDMNSQSSRSHAIFTITMEQKKNPGFVGGASHDDTGDDILCAKLHLVDLAGSERAKRTGADGMRFKEGIHINKGLLALGNVISALGDEKRRKEGGHVPYRDSKLTRLLQDSLGGNSKTLMIACVSPAETNAEETLNTLKYANRARNIQNKAVINRDPMAAEMHRLRSQVEQLEAELLLYRGGASVPFDELQILKHKVSLLEASNKDLRQELQERQTTCEHLMQNAINAQVEKDKLIMRMESIQNGQVGDDIGADVDQDYNLLRSYVTKIQELEGELIHLRNSASKRISAAVDLDQGDSSNNGSERCLSGLSVNSGSQDAELSDAVEVHVKELEHESLQEKFDKELQDLDKMLEQKEAEMKRYANVDTSVLKQHYEKKVLELEQEKKALQREIEELKLNLADVSSSSGDNAQKLKEEYLQKLTLLDSKVLELKKKQDAQTQLLRQKQKSDEAARRLQNEIQRIKSQKVQLQNKIKHEGEQYRLWKAQQEKEVIQLKKEGRRNEYEMHKLLALNQRQKMVLQRKTEEASMATKRLKDLLESRKASARETGGANGNSLGLLALVQAIDHELEVMVRVHEVRSEYERQMEERGRMTREIAKLEEEMQIQGKFGDSPLQLSPGARNSRIFALKNMLASTASTLVSMASQLSEAEEREKGFSGRGRWNQVRSLSDAKNLMNHLFNVACSSRCLLSKLQCDIRQLLAEKVELALQLKSQDALIRKLAKSNAAQRNILHSESNVDLDALKYYNTRKQESRTSTIFMEDMDISEADKSASDNEDDDDLVGCSCSKTSSCKTARCQCLEKGSHCGELCGCISTKCTNRSISPEIAPRDSSSSLEKVEDSELASQGAALLQSALTDKGHANSVDDEKSRRKPLSDIGNKLAKPNEPKPSKRKKWGKQSIQLVPIDAPANLQDTPTEVVDKPEVIVVPEDLPLKLPRAMRSLKPSSSNILRERNSDPVDATVSAKDVEAEHYRANVARMQETDAKENQAL
ncbi:hypothetical protein MLD38_034819 [Melastoma candidum]|uniref:Uncharacterized protein n=1 Tax=Melastoma candidum TaxID=119954 RepID=A0ACB9MBS6_9MYRT|nr:hypothetical protein MLD38_034819 [Melastoma candidum]